MALLYKVNTVALHLSNRKTNVLTIKASFALYSMWLFSVLSVLWEDSELYHRLSRLWSLIATCPRVGGQFWDELLVSYWGKWGVWHGLRGPDPAANCSTEERMNVGKCMTSVFWANLWIWQACGTFAALPYDCWVTLYFFMTFVVDKASLNCVYRAQTRIFLH